MCGVGNIVPLTAGPPGTGLRRWGGSGGISRASRVGWTIATASVPIVAVGFRTA
jgi:hypothetical protein